VIGIYEMNGSLANLLANLVATLFMVGLIWLIQVVHYPLFNEIGEQHYVNFQKRHQASITYIVGPMMLVELVTAVLMIWYPVDGVSKTLVFVGVGLVCLVWASTALIQVPCHDKLLLGFDPEAYRWLVRSNWIRTLGWTARGVLVVVMLIRVLAK
jgi:hypothetical protein